MREAGHWSGFGREWFGVWGWVQYGRFGGGGYRSGEDGWESGCGWGRVDEQSGEITDGRDGGLGWGYGEQQWLDLVK